MDQDLDAVATESRGVDRTDLSESLHATSHQGVSPQDRWERGEEGLAGIDLKAAQGGKVQRLCWQGHGTVHRRAVDLSCGEKQGTAVVHSVLPESSS